MTLTTTERGTDVLPLFADGDADWFTKVGVGFGSLLGAVGGLFVLLTKVSEWRKKWQTDEDDVVFARDGRVSPVLQQQLADTRAEMRELKGRLEDTNAHLADCLDKHARAEEREQYNARVMRAQEETIRLMLDQQRASGSMTDTAVHRALEPVDKVKAEEATSPPPPAGRPPAATTPAGSGDDRVDMGPDDGGDQFSGGD